MANSLRNKIKHFCYTGELSESERNRLLNALDDTELEQQPCEDCISREEAIRIAEQGQIQGYEWQFKKLCNLPSVTPKVEWIPVSEKMPDINIHVLAQFVMGGMAECYYAHNWWHIVGGFRISGDEVIAWMPLPEAYKEENNGE